MIDKTGFKGHYQLKIADNTISNMRAIKEAEFLTLEDKTQSGYQTTAAYENFPNGGTVDVVLDDNYDRIMEAFFTQRGVKFTKCEK